MNILYRIRTQGPSGHSRIIAEYITRSEAVANLGKAREAHRRAYHVTITEDTGGQWIGDYRSQRNNF